MKKIRQKIRKIKNKVLNVDTQTPYEKIEGNEAILVSFPKAGRTWVRLMLKELEIIIPVTHDGAGHVPRVPFDKLIKDKSAYKNIKVIFLIRDPRDTVVSGFFHSTKRKNIFSGTISDFIRNNRHGIRKIVEFHKNWHKATEYLHNFLLIRYEDLQKNTFTEMKKILNFLEKSNISDEKIKETIEFAKFDNMQKLEKQGYFKNNFGEGLVPGNKNDTNSFKTRRGKVGGYKDTLSASDIEYCNKILTDFEYPFPYLKD